MKRMGWSLLIGVVLTLGAWSGASGGELPLKSPAATTIPPISGHISLYAGGSHASLKSFDDISDTLFVYGGDGRMNIWLSPAISIQLDAEAQGTTGFEFDGYNLGGRLTGIFGGHLAWRDPQAYALGAFGALAGANNLTFGGTMTYGLIGLEAQSYFANATLYPQAGYVSRIDGPKIGGFQLSPDEGWFARLQGRYFLTPNDKVAAEIGWARLKHGPVPGISGVHSILSWGASYEHRFGTTPWSLFIEYAGFESKTSGWSGAYSVFNGNKLTENMVLFGIRAHIGDATLLSQDRSGATFDMPKFTRAVPWTCALVCVE